MMPLEPEHAPMGANLTDDGATFRLWAPAAQSVSVRGSFNGWVDTPMQRISNGHWFVHVRGVTEGAQYKFYVCGLGGEGFKRDPRARSIGDQPEWPQSNCVVTRPGSFRWHDHAFRP